MKRAVVAIWRFVAGDDPLVAIGVVTAVALTAALEAAGVSAWWLLPPAVVVLLTGSLRR